MPSPCLKSRTLMHARLRAPDPREFGRLPRALADVGRVRSGPKRPLGLVQDACLGKPFVFATFRRFSLIFAIFWQAAPSPVAASGASLAAGSRGGALEALARSRGALGSRQRLPLWFYQAA